MLESPCCNCTVYSIEVVCEHLYVHNNLKSHKPELPDTKISLVGGAGLRYCHTICSAMQPRLVKSDVLHNNHSNTSYFPRDSTQYVYTLLIFPPTLLILARHEMRSCHSVDSSKLLRALSTEAEYCLYLASLVKSPSPSLWLSDILSSTYMYLSLLYPNNSSSNTRGALLMERATPQMPHLLGSSTHLWLEHACIQDVQAQ